MAENKTFDLVIHHSDADGYCSAALVSLTQSAFGNTYAVFCSVEHGENDKILDKIKNSIDMITDKDRNKLDTLYILDFSIDIELFKELYNKYGFSRLVFIDHHETSKELAEKYSEFCDDNGIAKTIIHDTSHSATMLTYDKYYRKYAVKKYMYAKMIVSYVDTYDTWTFGNNYDVVYFIAGTDVDESFKRDRLTEWMYLLTTNKIDVVNRYINIGKYVISQQLDYANKILDSDKIDIRKIEYDGKKYDAIYLNVPKEWTNLVSDRILKNLDIDVVVTYNISTDKMSISFRSGEKSEFDCGKYSAEIYSGGGHFHASGASKSFSTETLFE